jgi:hypothetical protein
LLWESPKVILKGEVLEVRNVDGRLHIADEARHPDKWDPRSSLMTHTGRGMIHMTDARCAADVPRSFPVYVRSKVSVKI